MLADHAQNTIGVIRGVGGGDYGIAFRIEYLTTVFACFHRLGLMESDQLMADITNVESLETQVLEGENFTYILIV